MTLSPRNATSASEVSGEGAHKCGEQRDRYSENAQDVGWQPKASAATGTRPTAIHGAEHEHSQVRQKHEPDICDTYCGSVPGSAQERTNGHQAEQVARTDPHKGRGTGARVALAPTPHARTAHAPLRSGAARGAIHGRALSNANCVPIHTCLEET
eukprot:9202997-Pyramimonas_sp.AAC.1